MIKRNVEQNNQIRQMKIHLFVELEVDWNLIRR